MDTKSVEVNLSKYDQKLEDLAPERAKDLGKQFQKLKKQPNRRGPRRRTETEAEKIRRLEAGAPSVRSFPLCCRMKSLYSTLRQSCMRQTRR